MWDLNKKFSLGGYRQRLISTLAASFVMAIFSVLTLFTTPVLAAEATRSGDSLTYAGKTFTELKTTGPSPDKLPPGLPSGTSGYQFIDTSANKTHFILTAGVAASATSGQYVTYDGVPPGSLTNQSSPTTVGIIEAPPGDLESAADGSTSGCSSDYTHGIGWILCPTVNFLAASMDHLYEILSTFLVVQPIKNDPNSSIYRMWAIVRDIANICFVIAFLFIVYSQVTSLGISNYGIKRMLPRLIVAAILVNASFWIAALAVDASNVMGQSIHSLFSNVFTSLNTTEQYTEVRWSDMGTYVLSGGAIAGLGVLGGHALIATSLPGALPLLVPVLLGVIIAALIAILVMAARQALIICLVIVSPLAFVAYLLPNTEKYFDKWKDLFITMLVMFPAFSLVFSGARLAGLAIIQSAGGSLILVILGMAVMVAPVVVTPLLIKFSGSLIGKIAGLANNPKKGALDRTRRWAERKSGEERAKVLAGRGRNTAFNRGSQAIDRKRRGREEQKKVDEGSAELNFAASDRGVAIEEQVRANANRKKDISNTFDRNHKQLEYQSRMLDVDKKGIDNEFDDSEYGHAANRAQRGVERDKKLIENRHDTNWNNAVRTNPSLLNKELELMRSSEQADSAKNKLDAVRTETISEGEDSEYIHNLRGVDPETRTGMLRVAREIKSERIAATAATTAKSSNERQISENYTAALKENVVTIDGQTIVQYAAGVRGEKGERAITAKAKSEVSGALVEDVKNIRSTMDYDLATNNSELRKKFEQTHIFAEKVAFAQAMAKNGGPGIAELRKLLGDIGDFSNPDGKLIGTEDMFDFKELLAAESNIMSAGKDIEFFLTNTTKNDADGNPVLSADGKPIYSTFKQISHDPKTWTNMSASNFASQNAATQFYAFEYLYNTNRDAYMQVVNSIRSNPSALGSIKQGVYEKFSIYSDSQIASSLKRGKPLPAPGSIAKRDAGGNLIVVDPI